MGLWKAGAAATYIYSTVIVLTYRLWQQQQLENQALHEAGMNITEALEKLETSRAQPEPVQLQTGRPKSASPLSLAGTLIEASWELKTGVAVEGRQALLPEKMRVCGREVLWSSLFTLTLKGNIEVRAADCWPVVNSSTSYWKQPARDPAKVLGSLGFVLRCPSDIEVRWSVALLRLLPSNTEVLRTQIIFDDPQSFKGPGSSAIETMTLWGFDEVCYANKDVSNSCSFRNLGDVDGSPLVGQLSSCKAWLALEHPRSRSSGAFGRSTAVSISKPSVKLPYYASLGVFDEAEGSVLPSRSARANSSVISVLLRRNFGDYLSVIRASPARSFLYYDSWYDLRRAPCVGSSPLGYTACSAAHPMTDVRSLETLHELHFQLKTLRGVPLDGFLLNDGWDDPQTPWSLHPTNFPKGLADLRAATVTRDVSLGAWMSPWGGMLANGQQRLERAQALGFEMHNEEEHKGLRISGPLYYKHFRDAARDLLFKSGVRFFRFDGIGDGIGTTGAGEFSDDVEALLHLTSDLREDSSVGGDDRGLWVDLATGAWPSPFWLLYVDSIWRDGPDLGKQGEGTPRQKWITFRDATIYQRVVQRSPLFPLFSLSFHALVWSKAEEPGVYLASFEFEDFQDEVRSAVLAGASPLPFNVQHELLTPQHWDIIADAANFSRSRAPVLKDTHWIGGNPGHGQVYGYSSYTCYPCSGLFTWRNPRLQEQSVTFTLRDILEVPRSGSTGFPDSEGKWRINQLWAAGAGGPGVQLTPTSWNVKITEQLTLKLDGTSFKAFEVRPLVEPELFQ